MTLLRRAPREIYRVYSEEEYLSGAGSEPIGDLGEWPVWEPDLAIELERPIGRSPAPVEGAGRVGGQRRTGRAVGVAMLAGTVGAVSCVVFLNIALAHGGGGARGRVLAATRPAPVTHAAAVAVADAQPEAAPSRPAAVRATATRRSRVPPIRRSSPNHFSRRPAHLPAHLPVRRRIDVAVGAGDVPHRAPGEVSAASVSAAPVSAAPVSATPVSEAPVSEAPVSAAPVSAAPVSTTASTATASVGTAPAGPAGEERPEFGFER